MSREKAAAKAIFDIRDDAYDLDEWIELDGVMSFDVHELGEDGDAWIVSPSEGWGGGGENDARWAVVEWLHQCVGDDADAFGCHVTELINAPATHPGHWAWHTHDLYDDALLIRLENDHAGIETFTGWLFSRCVPPVQSVKEYLEAANGDPE